MALSLFSIVRIYPFLRLFNHRADSQEDVDGDEGSRLHVVDLVGVVAENARQSRSAQCRQLFPREGRGWYVALVPVTVPLAQQAELSRDQAVQSRADGRAVQRPLGQSSWQEVDLGHVPGGRERLLPRMTSLLQNYT